jgi:serine/threonine protein kinase/tetratricopeptide (TPR) repeat protein
MGNDPTDFDADTTRSSDFPAFAAASDPPRLLKDRYLVGYELGRGGFAVTYLAIDQQVANRNVVVKILHGHRVGQPWAMKKFRDEMEALARIDHPGVVAVIDYGELAGKRPFIVMQYLHGSTLRKLLPKSGLPFEQIADIIQQTGRALTAAHKAGILHRDLKPENIMVQSRAEGADQIRLIDFGVASILDHAGVDSTTNIFGTWNYMAPEQLDGKSSEASDIYQMGVLAYEMVTGAPPIRANTPREFMDLMKQGVTVPPRDLRPELPPAADRIIMRALASQPNDRYPRAQEFGDDLARELVTGWISESTSGAASLPTRTIFAKRKSRFPLNRILALIALLVLIALGIAAWRWPRPNSAGSVAILPFQNRTGDADAAYLSTGITDSLIDDLSHIPTLHVTARGAVQRFDTPKVDALAAARALHVDRVVDGSISSRGNELRIEAELIDVRSGERLWGKTYTHEVSSMAGDVERISTELTDQLRLKLSGSLKDRLARQYRTNPESYQSYLKGRFHLNLRSGPDFKLAIDFFNRSIDANPDFAPAYAGLAYAYGLLASFGAEIGAPVPALSLEKSRSAAQHALDLDGTLDEAYTTLAAVEMQADFDWRGAEDNLRRSIALNPASAETHEQLALVMTALGRFDDSLTEVNTAQQLEPDSIGVRMAKCLILYQARRFDESLAESHKLPESEDNVALDGVAMNYWMKNMPKEAMAAIDRLPPSAPLRKPLMAAGFAKLNEMDKANGLLESGPQVDPYYFGLAYHAMGRDDVAMDRLELAYRQREFAVCFIGVDPLLDPLRSQPRFKILLANTNLSSANP